MKRVYILASHSLFGGGIRCLIGKEATLEIVGHEVDPEKALEQIERLQPDVVIIDRDGSETEFTLKMLHLLVQETGHRVIGLDPHKNVLWIYRKKRWVVREVGDLLKAIES
jgi:DNA-binding NarL/FixJ family response regulator